MSLTRYGNMSAAMMCARLIGELRPVPDALIVRTYRPERDRRVVVVLDSSRASAVRVGNETRFDLAGVEAALFIAALANAGGDRVDLLTYGSKHSSALVVGRTSYLLHRMSTALSQVFPRLLAQTGPCFRQKSPVLPASGH